MKNINKDVCVENVGSNIFLIDAFSQQMLRIQLIEKETFNCPELYEDGVISESALLNFVKDYCHGGKELKIPRPEEFIREEFSTYIFRCKPITKSTCGIYLLCLPKKFNGKPVESPFIQDMEFDFHDVEQ